MKGYSFGELVKLAEAAMPRAGGTFGGAITAPQVYIANTQSAEPSAATRFDWVNARLNERLALAGGVMTGRILGKSTGTPNSLAKLSGQHAAFTVADVATDPAAQGGVAYVEALHSSARTTEGYVQHLSLGIKRKSGVGWHDAYLATGGSDTSPTQEWLFGASGMLQCPGPIRLAGTAQDSNGAAVTRKDYVDGLVAKCLLLTGGSLTGQLVVSHDDTPIVIRPKTAGRASYIRGQDNAGINQWLVGDPDGSGALSLQAKDSYLNVGTGGVKIGGNTTQTGPWYQSTNSERYNGMQGLTTGNAERYAIFHDSTAATLNLRSQGGPAVTINSNADISARDVAGRAFGIGAPESGYYQATLQAPVAGSFANWQDRAPALQLSCPLAADSAYSVWRATQWGRAHIASMDVHLPTYGTPHVTLNMFGGEFQHRWVGPSYQLDGEVRTTNGGIFDRGHLVYSPHNVPSLTAAQGNSDVVAGNAGNVGAYMFMQNHPSLALGAKTPGEIAPGSHLRPCQCDNDWDDWVDWYVPAGNWRCQGYSNFGGPTSGGAEGDFTAGKTLWIRCN